MATPPSKHGYDGLVKFCEALGEPLAPYMRRIARAYFGPAREVAAILPRGNGKTHLAALLGLWNLLTVPGAEIVIGAPSRRQAEIVLDRMKGFVSRNALLEDRITLRHWQLRHEETGGLLDVVSADGSLAHGFSPTLAIGDEVWAWRERSGMLEAFETGLVKRPGAKVLLISTAAARLDSPLGRMRARAMAQGDVHRRGVVTEAKGDLHWLEWSLDDEESLTPGQVKKANPAKWITTAALRAQRDALPEPAFAQFHANRWGVGEGQWLRPGVWNACAADYEIEDGEPVWAGVDIGGTRAASACAIVTADLRVGIKTWQGDDAVLKVAAHVEELAEHYDVRELAYDPWRFRSEALRLEEAGLLVVEFPQSTTRMVPATEGLFSAIVEGRLKHPGDEVLDQHVANVVARETPRGYRLDKGREEDQIDAVVALAMAVERAQHAAEAVPAGVVGWL